jgi:hypothetical protein
VRHSQENITEQTYGDNNQLSQDKLQSMNNLTDKNQPESASHGHVITIITKEKENSEEDKHLYKKRKGMNTKSIRGSYKRRKFANLVIKLDNKFELKNSFNKWNNMTQINDLEKNKSINIKQIMKDNKNKKSNAYNNERFTDNTNSDTIQRKTNEYIRPSNTSQNEKISNIKNKLMSQYKTLIIRHFFLKWNKDIKSKNTNNEYKGINIIENILRRYIVRYLVMHGKILKFKKLLIKYALSRHK